MLDYAEAYWLKPQLVCEVSYTGITEDGVMRHPSFEGMRDNKNAKDVHPYCGWRTWVPLR